MNEILTVSLVLYVLNIQVLYVLDIQVLYVLNILKKLVEW